MKDKSGGSSFLDRHPIGAPAGLLALATLALFNRFLLPSTQKILSLFDKDMPGQFVWWRQFGFEELRKGHLALWNPYIYSGAPFFGGFQSALLYPPNWLFMVLPLPFALNFSIAFHTFLGGWFTYLWIKGRGSHIASAYSGAFMFMFGSAYFLHVVPGHLPNLCTMAWIPGLFFILDQYRLSLKNRWILAGMATLTLQIFSGHIQYCYYTVVMLAVYALFFPPGGQRQKARFWTGLFLMGAGAGLLSAVQLLTGWDAVQESSRSEGLSLRFVDIAATQVERYWCLLVPYFFGGWTNYWGGGIYWEGALYVSVTAFILALYGWRVSDHPQKNFFAGSFLFLLLVGIGKKTFLFTLLCDYFPLFNRFRGVSKLNILASICLIALAAMGIDLLFKKDHNPKSLARGMGWGALAFALLSVAFYLAPRVGGGWLFKDYLGHADSMAGNLFGSGLLLGALALLTNLSFRMPKLKWVFLIFIFLELFCFAWSNLFSFEWGALLEKMKPLQTVYQQDPGDYRIFTDGYNYTLGTRGLGAWGDDPLVPGRYNSFATLTGTFLENYRTLHAPLQNYPKALALTRLKYAFYERNGQLIGQKLDLPATPRFFLVGGWERAPLEEIWSKIIDPHFNLRKKAWLESDPGIISASTPPQGQVSLHDLSTDKVEIEARLSQPALLLLTDNYSKGWKVEPISTDVQRQYKVMPANGFQMAVPLSAGAHRFYLEYRPTAFVIGKWISIVSWICFFGLLVLKRHDL